jgi:hypothetical protein
VRGSSSSSSSSSCCCSSSKGRNSEERDRVRGATRVKGVKGTNFHFSCVQVRRGEVALVSVSADVTCCTIAHTAHLSLQKSTTADSRQEDYGRLKERKGHWEERNRGATYR